MNIDGREIGKGQPPYIVAEIGAGHRGKIDDVFRLMDAAKDAGASACKLQTYTPDSLTIDCGKPDFIIKDGAWKGRKLYELYQSASTPRDWHKPLFDYAREIGITLFSTPFSVEDVDFLEELGCPAYKVASFEINHFELLARIAAAGKPVIVSTGMATNTEISEAICALIDTVDAHDISLLHCISGYPAPVSEANMLNIRTRLRRWSLGPIGFSDHTEGNVAAICAVALGASIFEKHIGFASSEDGGFAMSATRFHLYCDDVRAAWSALQKTEAESEEPSRQMRRSIYAIQDIAEGEEFTKENIRVIRPGYGLHPSKLGEVLGKKASKGIERGMALSEEMI